MKTNYYIIILLLVMYCSCSAPGDNPEYRIKIEQEIIATETAFSDYSQKNGFAKALAEFSANDAIKLNDNEYPTFGKAQLQKEADSDSIGNSRGTITWKPLDVRVAQSGDLAAVFGDWYFTFKSSYTSTDTTLYGNYMTVWVKQQDGSWKFVMDGGGPTPGPTSSEMLELLK